MGRVVKRPQTALCKTQEHRWSGCCRTLAPEHAKLKLKNHFDEHRKNILATLHNEAEEVGLFNDLYLRLLGQLNHPDNNHQIAVWHLL